MRAALAEARPRMPRTLTWHTVRKGETLLSIAKQAEGESRGSGGRELPVREVHASRPASS